MNNTKSLAFSCDPPSLRLAQHTPAQMLPRTRFKTFYESANVKSQLSTSFLANIETTIHHRADILFLLAKKRKKFVAKAHKDAETATSEVPPENVSKRIKSSKLESSHADGEEGTVMPDIQLQELASKLLQAL